MCIRNTSELRLQLSFFFSSRRRHTRSFGDWSSDVCSSDLELRLPLEMSPGREAACRAVFGTWGFFLTMHGKTAPSCGLHSQGGVRRGVRASGSYQEGTGKSGSYGMWNHPRGHVWNVVVIPASS